MKQLFFAGLLGMTFLLSAQELMFTPGRTMGVNVNARENNRWKSPWMDVTEKIKSADLFETAGDFFQIQYGKPFVFQSDLIREFRLKTTGGIRGERRYAPVPHREKRLGTSSRRGTRG